MVRISLKPNSAEYADKDDGTAKLRCCDMPGCTVAGEHRAPKDRMLKDYYWFCQEHARDYNKAWNYFTGMSQHEIEDHMLRSYLWDRPTRKFTQDPYFEQNLYRKAWQTYNFSTADPFANQKQKEENFAPAPDKNAPEYKAMITLGLEPPLSMKALKKRYKDLAKKYHPDVNNGDKDSEERLKDINMAYTILRLAAQKYEKLVNPEN